MLELLGWRGDGAAKVERRGDDAAGIRERMKMAIAAKAPEDQGRGQRIHDDLPREPPRPLTARNSSAWPRPGEMADWEILATLNVEGERQGHGRRREVRTTASAVPCRGRPQRVAPPWPPRSFPEKLLSLREP